LCLSIAVHILDEYAAAIACGQVVLCIVVLCYRPRYRCVRIQ